MANTVLLGNRLRRQIRAKVWPMLEEAGFVEFAPLRAYRLADDRIELVEFATFKPEWREPRWLGGGVHANGATFALHVATYFHDGSEASHRPKASDCHCRTCLSHGNENSVGCGRTFYPGANGEHLEEVVEQAVQALRARGFDHLKHYAESRKAPPAYEEVGLSTEEAAEMMRICREGRTARTGKLDDYHRRVHLADEHFVRA